MANSFIFPDDRKISTKLSLGDADREYQSTLTVYIVDRFEAYAEINITVKVCLLLVVCSRSRVCLEILFA